MKDERSEEEEVSLVVVGGVVLTRHAQTTCIKGPEEFSWAGAIHLLVL